MGGMRQGVSPAGAAEGPLVPLAIDRLSAKTRRKYRSDDIPVGGRETPLFFWRPPLYFVGFLRRWHDHFGIGYARAQILLGDDGVYLDVRFE